MIFFDGYQTASQLEFSLKSQVVELAQRGKNLAIASILFAEDQGSILYTQLKKEAAQRVGIDYRVTTFSMRDPQDLVIAKIHEFNAESAITGIIIQKPWRQTWQDVTGGSASDFASWWQQLVQEIAPDKDVDGLHPSTLEAIKAGTWQQQGKVLPATCRAVLMILTLAQEQLTGHSQLPVSAKVVILGKSDLLGQPLYYYLKNLQQNVEMIGSRELADRVENGQALLDADVIISATGRHNLITADMVKDKVIVIDVGEPKPDVDFTAVAQKAAFMTPVPGGVGPMTVVSLLENCVELKKAE